MRNFQSLLKANKRFHEAGFKGNPDQLTWQDILYEYLALADPVDAAKRYQANRAGMRREFGETEVHTTQWIAALGWLGQFDPEVSSDWPTAVCFVKEGKRTYVAYNAKPETGTVKFSDGESFDVPPGLHCFESK